MNIDDNVIENDLMDTTVERKESLLDRFFAFLKKRRDRKRTKGFEYISKFREFLHDIDEKDAGYEPALQAVGLCEEALRVARQRLSFADKIKNVDEKLQELSCFETLTDEDSDQLKDLLSRYMSLSKERSALIYQITEFDNSLSYMDKLEDDANMALTDISDAERRQRALKHDLSYLEGEKAELEYEKEFLEKGQTFIYRFTIIMVSVFGIVAVILAFLYMFQEISIFFPVSILIFLLIFLVFLLHMFRRRLNYELQLNIKKQQRAVELLNKKNAVFAHYSNFLNYEYRKYRVKSAQMLKTNLNDYGNYKHLTTRIDSIRNIMSQTEKQIEKFLHSKNLSNLKISVERFAQDIDIEDKKQYFRELTREQQVMEKNLSELDIRHEEIWDLLVVLDESDASDTKIVGQIIEAYLNEVTRLFMTNKLEETGDGTDGDTDAS